MHKLRTSLLNSLLTFLVFMTKLSFYCTWFLRIFYSMDSVSTRLISSGETIPFLRRSFYTYRMIPLSFMYLPRDPLKIGSLSLSSCLSASLMLPPFACSFLRYLA